MKKVIILSLVLFIFAACESGSNISRVKVDPQYKGTIQKGKWNKNLSMQAGGQTINYQIYFPSKFKLGKPFKTIILLHDFGKDKREFEIYSRIEGLAEKYNTVLAAPSMGNTIYASKYFPDTKSKWNSIPGTVFIGEHFIPHLQKTFGLAASKQLTSIIGVGNGGFGAVLISELYSDKIGNTAGIDGYYDHLVMTRKTIIKNIYGDYRSNRQRWETEDNIFKNAESLKNTKLIIIHGVKNVFYRVEHARMLAIKMKSLGKTNPGFYKFKYIEKSGGKYEWRHWNIYLNTVFEFFY